MRMEGGAREETQVRRREAMIASQHVASNYNVVFRLSLSLHLSLPLMQPFTPSRLACLGAQG